MHYTLGTAISICELGNRFIVENRESIEFLRTLDRFECLATVSGSRKRVGNEKEIGIVAKLCFDVDGSDMTTVGQMEQFLFFFFHLH